MSEHQNDVPESIRNAFEGDPEEAAEAALDAATGRGGRGRGKRDEGPKPQQADMADIVLEDPQLEEYLRDVYEHEEAAAKYRAANKGIKTRMLEDHANAVNSDDDGVHTGYVRVGGFRFKPRYVTREAVTREVTYGAGKDWEALEITKLV